MCLGAGKFTRDCAKNPVSLVVRVPLPLHASSDISNQAFQFLVVAQPKKPLKTFENHETWTLKNLCLIL